MVSSCSLNGCLLCSQCVLIMFTMVMYNVLFLFLKFCVFLHCSKSITIAEFFFHFILGLWLCTCALCNCKLLIVYNYSMCMTYVVCVVFVVAKFSITTTQHNLCALHVLEIINILLAIVQLFYEISFSVCDFLLCVAFVIAKLYIITTPMQLVCIF